MATRRIPPLLVRLLRRAFLGFCLIAATIYLVRAWDSRRAPALEAWHRARFPSEFRAADEPTLATFEAWMAREEIVFRELDREVYERVEASDELLLSRYYPGGLADPRGFEANWNRSFRLEPDPEVPFRGAALLLHGLTDSPYSLRSVGELLAARGYTVFGWRLPGHGTAPGALTESGWPDWMAAGRVGLRVAREAAGEGELVLVGYSLGGALSLQLALESLEVDSVPRPDALVLFSPAVGVSPFGFLAVLHKGLSWSATFDRFAWLELFPEFDPYKYNSFPKEAGYQTWRLSERLGSTLAVAERKGLVADLPPILTFQSLVDDTVSTPAIAERLYARLENEESELVLFDTNRAAALRPFFRHPGSALWQTLLEDPGRRYRLTVLTNSDPEGTALVELSSPRGGEEARARALGLAWPQRVVSLSHVALPFQATDPLYGSLRAGEEGSLHLGSLAPRGERRLLRVPMAQLMRLRYNPFFPYVESRLDGFLRLERARR